jgi:flagellar hook-associated protein 2
MGTVGISFGSATSGSGFDVTTTVSSILAIEAGVETPWKTQLASLKAQDTALSGLGTNLSALSTAVGALTSFDGVMSAKQGSSSDTNVLTLTSASTSAVAGSHTIIVTSLAQTSSKYSDAVTSPTDTLSGSLTLQIGAGTTKTITIDSTNNTLTSLAQAINQGSYGVSANVVTDTNGSRLSLVSSTGGLAGEITLTPSLTDATTSTSLGFTTGQDGVNAQLTVDGLKTSSASNTVTNAIPGVTFQLLSAAAGTSLQVQITNDNVSIETAMQSMVTAYNAVATSLTTQEGKDSTGAAEPLFGNPTLALLQSQLSGSMLGGNASGSISNIAQLGLSLNPDGTLTLNASTLDATLNSNFADVTGFFQTAGSFGQTLTTTLNSLGSVSINGAIYLALQQNSTQEKGLNDDVTAEEARIAIDKTSLTKELNLANQILQSIPQQLNEIDEMYSAVTGYNQSGH